MRSRTTRIRGFFGYLLIGTVLFYISLTAYRNHYHHEDEDARSVSSDIRQHGTPYNQFIDQGGIFLPYSGYKILQFIKKPLPQGLIDFNDFFTRHEQLNSYFKPVPATAYHITLVNLKNKTSYDTQQLQTLTDEQILLDKDDTEITGSGINAVLMKDTEIRIEIELTNEKLEEYQERWKTKFSDLIIAQYTTSFYVTVAYQYKPISNQEIFREIDDSLKTIISTPFDVPLDPIEICSYQDLVSYTAILPDFVPPTD